MSRNAGSITRLRDGDGCPTPNGDSCAHLEGVLAAFVLGGVGGLSLDDAQKRAFRDPVRAGARRAPARRAKAAATRWHGRLKVEAAALTLAREPRHAIRRVSRLRVFPDWETPPRGGRGGVALC